jgi:hypothetical protein
VVDEVIAESTLDAKVTLVDRIINITSHTNDIIPPYTKINTASAPAIRADSFLFA